jgi:hypothetical protein
MCSQPSEPTVATPSRYYILFTLTEQSWLLIQPIVAHLINNGIVCVHTHLAVLLVQELVQLDVNISQWLGRAVLSSKNGTLSEKPTFSSLPCSIPLWIFTYWK